MGYTGQHRHKYLEWKRTKSGSFDSHKKDPEKIAHLAATGLSGTDGEAEFITRLCEVATVSEDIEIRVGLARLAGIELERVDIYKGAVGRQFGYQCSRAVLKVAYMAVAAHNRGESTNYDLLSASVGYYPLGPNDFLIEAVTQNMINPIQDPRGALHPLSSWASQPALKHNSG